MPDHLTIEDIVAGCLKGHSNCQRELVNRYSASLYSVCLRYMSDEAKAKDVLQDWLKDVAKDKLSEGSGAIWAKVVNGITQTPLEQAAETAITAFLLLVDRQLGDELKLSEDEHKKFQKPLRNFIRETKVREILGSPLSESCDQLDIQTLKETWEDLGLRDLPDDFDWLKLEQEYLHSRRNN